MIDAGNFLDQIAFEGKTPSAGDYIRSKRKILKLTLFDLEKITNIDKTNLSAYENNKKEIGVKVAVKIGVALNLDPKILLESSIANMLKSPDVKKISIVSKKILKLKAKKAA